jgi:hypothetical protein
MVTVSGGYSYVHIEDTGVIGTGWINNGLYKFITMGSKFAHGVSFGHISLTSTEGVGQ